MPTSESTNARDTPDVLAALTPFGYDAVHLDEGLALADAAEAEAEEASPDEELDLDPPTTGSNPPA